MTSRLKKAAYVALIVAAVVVVAGVVGLLVMGSLFMEALDESLQDIEMVYDDPYEIAESMRTEESYAAMYERHPDAVEQTDISPLDVHIEVTSTDADTGNRLVLWLYATPYSDVFQMSATCWDSNGNVIDEGTAQHAAGYIRTTDCITP